MGLALTHPRALIPALHQLNPSPPWSLPLPQRTAWGGEGQAETALLGGGTLLSPISIPQQGGLKSQRPTPRLPGSQRDYFISLLYCLTMTHS